MIRSLIIFVAIAFQEKKAMVPAESTEHKFLEAKHESIGLLLLDALKAETNCMRVDTYDVCHGRFKPLKDKIDAEGDFVIAQLAKVDECKKTYRNTIDKKTSDLTVRETTSVRACQLLDLYPLDMPAQQQKGQ